MLYVENKYGPSISVVDIAEYKVVSTIPLDKEMIPDDVIVADDGKVLYVNVAYASAHGNPDALADHSDLVAFSTQSEKEIWRARIKGNIGHMVMSPDNRHIYNALFDRWYVARVDLRTYQVDDLPVEFIGGHGIRISADGKRLYVGSILMPEINVLDLEKKKVTQRILFRDAVRPFGITRDERTAYVQLSWLHGFEVVDLKRNLVRGTVHLPELPPDAPKEKTWNTVDHGLEITPDETHVVTVATTGNYAAVHRLPGLELVGTVPVGKDPSWVIVSDDGKLAFVSSRKSDEVSVISIHDAKEVQRIKVGRHPQRMWHSRAAKKAA